MKISSNTQDFPVTSGIARSTRQQTSESNSTNEPSQKTKQQVQSLPISSEQRSQLVQNFQNNTNEIQGHSAIAQYQSIANFEQQQQLNHMLGIDELV